MSCVLTVTSFQNLECTAWWLTVYKVTQNSTSSYRMTTTAFPTSRMHLLVKFRCYDYKNLDFMTKKKFTLFLSSIVKKYCFWFFLILFFWFWLSPSVFTLIVSFLRFIFLFKENNLQYLKEIKVWIIAFNIKAALKISRISNTRSPPWITVKFYVMFLLVSVSQTMCWISSVLIVNQW